MSSKISDLTAASALTDADVFVCVQVGVNKKVTCEDAFGSFTLAAFAPTTSAELASVISDETGSGSLVFSGSPALTGTPTAPTAAASTNTTQLATTAFVQQELSSAVTGLLEFKGTTDCSGNPNYPSANKGDSYVVSVAGKIGGAGGISVDIGDWYIATADNAGGTEASVGASWGHMEHNLVGALLASNNLSDLANAATAVDNLGGASSTGSGGLVRATSPVFVTPTLGVATATSVNKVTITSPATGSTLTIDDGFTLHVTGNVTALSGSNTGDQTSVSGNAGTATALQTGRTIAMTGDVTWTSPSFDGTNNVTAAGTIGAGVITLAKTGTNIWTKGADVASANNLAPGADGDLFHVTGTTQINLIAVTNFRAGSCIRLIFDGVLTIKHGQTTSGANHKIRLLTAADLTTAANDTLDLCYDGADWYEIGQTRVSGTATALQTARTINGVSFDGTANITVTAAGSTLSDTVTIAKGGTGQVTAGPALDALTVKGADIASATTTNIGAATGRFIHVTGTTTITAFDTVAAGIERDVEFTGILTLTHNATSLILPTGANITTVAGDCATFVSEGSGNWRCLSYQRKDGTALAADVTAAAVFSTDNKIIRSDGTGKGVQAGANVPTISDAGAIISATADLELQSLNGAGFVNVGSNGDAVWLCKIGGVLKIGGGSSATEMRFLENSGNGSEYIALQAPASVVTSKVFVLPSTDGLANQALKTNGAGALGWIGGQMLQKVRSDLGTVATGTTTIPIDNTKPQSNEGDQYLSQAITPTAANNLLHIRAQVWISNSIASSALQAALFQDSGADALVSASTFMLTATAWTLLTLDWWVTAPSTTAITYKVRAGGNQAGTTTINGTAGGQLHGGVANSFLEITEWQA